MAAQLRCSAPPAMPARATPRWAAGSGCSVLAPGVAAPLRAARRGPAPRRGVATRAAVPTEERKTESAGAKPKAVAALLGRSPFAPAFVRSLANGISGALAFEAAHSATVMAGLLGRVGLAGLWPALPAARAAFQPLWGTDHVVGFAACVASYIVLAASVARGHAAERGRVPSGLRFSTEVAQGPAEPVIPPAGVRRATTPGSAPAAFPPPPLPSGRPPVAATASPAPSRAAALRDRRAYLKNFWYAAALSSDVVGGAGPKLVEMLDLRLVLWRDAATGVVQALPDACPHRGAPLSKGWVAPVGGDACAPASCVVCPYHGWAIDGTGRLRDVPANAEGEALPVRPVLQPASVTERGGFIYLFYGDADTPPERRPPLPLIPELEDPDWEAVYGEFTFDAPHTGVFENAIDFAHIHYLHNGSFGNSDAPTVRGMRAESDAWGVHASFRIQNKPVSWLWEWSRVPEVEVHAQALLPSTSVVAFELAFGISMITVVNTVPIDARRSVNRFALVRNFGRSRGAWPRPLQLAVDAFARRAMVRILSEDKAMVETLRPEAVAREVNVRADAAQTEFRKLRQAYIVAGHGVQPRGAPPLCDADDVCM